MAMKKTELAKVFSEVAEQGERINDIAGGIIRFVKDSKLETLESFNEQVARAYEQNGWSNVIGRPTPGSNLVPAPRAVKQYVSMFRAAYRLELEVLKFESVRQMIDAVAEKRREMASPQRQETDPELKGVMIRASDRMNGALWHDAIVVVEHLPDDAREDFEARLRKLVMRFQSKVPREVRRMAA